MATTPRTTHRSRRRLCGWLVTCLLFMQWAVASYACPQVGGGKLPDTTAPAAAEQVIEQAAEPVAEQAAHGDCAGDVAAMDPLTPQLCKAHCESGGQSVNSGSLAPDVPAAAALALVGVLDETDAARAAALAVARPLAHAAGPPAAASWPPLFLSLLNLRN